MNINVRQSWYGSSLLLLGIVMLFAFSNANGHHDHVHTSCNPLAELDACHRSMVHNDRANGCDHDAHVRHIIDLTNAPLALNREHIPYLLLSDFEPGIQAHSVAKFYYTDCMMSFAHHASTPRAPPHQVC